jgi:peptidoglycan/xylan/chitin deacetylase (PgdA/CDA1 family)
MLHTTNEQTSGDVLRVTFLVGADTPSTRLSIESVCAQAGIVPVAVLVDTAVPAFKTRMKNLRRNLRRNGWSYIPHRLAMALQAFTDKLAERAILPPGAVDSLLRKAFPERAFTLEDLGATYGFPVQRVGNLNGPQAAEALEGSRADLGIVLGTRILKPSTFTKPRLGCINLHKGKVPEYRGMPPGFWELYDGVPSAGVTVHFVDSKLDTGDVIETAEIPIHQRDTPDTLIEKMHAAGAAALVRAVQAIANRTVTVRKQPEFNGRARTIPTLAEVRELHCRLPHWPVETPVYDAAKDLLYLTLYYTRIPSLLRRWRRHTSRAAILLYHRVNDYSPDVLTVTTRAFAAHLLTIRKFYSTLTTEELVRRLRSGEPVADTSVLVHFDDAYQDVHDNGGPLLRAAGMPALWFVSSGFVGSDRKFAHDAAKYPFDYPNCTVADLRQWAANGFEVGAHTVNHVDLGTCTLEQAAIEVTESRKQLEQMLGQPVRLFSFPFGRLDNIRDEVRGIVRRGDYDALFSAHGGFVGERTDLFDIPRIGVWSGHKPLWLMMEIEGLGPGDIARMFRGSRGRTQRAGTPVNPIESHAAAPR